MTSLANWGFTMSCIKLTLVGLLFLGACSWSDSRPFLLNGARQPMQIESKHSDGQTLTTLLQPGMRIGLGIAGAPVERIQVRSGSEASENEVQLSPDEVRKCMAARSSCLGWKVQPDGSLVWLAPGDL